MKRNRILFICGMKGSGKTNFTMRLVAMYDRYVVVDYMDDNYPGTIVKSAEHLAELWDSCYPGTFRIVYKPSEDMDDLHKALRVIYHMGHEEHRTLIVLEEASGYTQPNLPAKHPVERLIRFGRHRHLDIAIVTQRPADTTRLATSQADTIIAFATHEPRDLAYLQTRFGKASSASLQRMAEDRNPEGDLKSVGHFLVWGETTGLPDFRRGRRVAVSGQSELDLDDEDRSVPIEPVTEPEPMTEEPEE